jgi:yeast amino acid transporter
MAIIFVMPCKVFAWFEYATSIMKILALFIFIFAAFAIVLGAGPDGYVHHGETWQNGLAFRNGFKGYSNSVLLAILAIGDNSFTGFLAGEAKTPRFSTAHAVVLIPIRVSVLYLISMIFIGLLVPATDEHLLGGSGVAASPFVIALEEAGIKGLPELLNVVIMFGVAAIGAESVYIASRILRSMAHQRLIPGWVAKVDRQGRPRIALGITFAVAIALTYCNLSAGGIEVFNWLGQIATTGYFMVWVVIGITSFRFRAALKAQDDPLWQQPYAWKCKWWPFPPAWLLICCSLYTGCSFYLALYPIGEDTPSAYSFFQYMIGIILILGCGILYKLIFRTRLRDPTEVDLQTGRRPLSVEDIKALDEYYSMPAWRRFLTYVQLW